METMADFPPVTTNPRLINDPDFDSDRYGEWLIAAALPQGLPGLANQRALSRMLRQRFGEEICLETYDGDDFLILVPPAQDDVLEVCGVLMERIHYHGILDEAIYIDLLEEEIQREWESMSLITRINTVRYWEADVADALSDAAPLYARQQFEERLVGP